MIISAYLGVAGLVDIGYRFYTTAEVAVAARITAGIVDAGDGWYSVDASVPATGNSVRWDSTGTAEAKAREYLDLFNDPLAKAVPDGYAAGTAGKALGDNLDTAGTTTLLSRIASALTITSGKVDVNDKTGFALAAAYDPAKTAAQAGAAMALTAAYDAAKTAAAPGAAMTLTAPYDAAKTAAAPGAAMALTSGERTTLSGVIWSVLTSALTAVGSIGKLLVDNIDAAVSSRSTYAGADTAGTATLLSRIASALTITGGKVDVNDKTGFALSAAYDPAKTAAQAGAAMTLTSAYDAAKAAAAPGAAMALTSGERTALSAAVRDVSNASPAAGSLGAEVKAGIGGGGSVDPVAIADQVLKRDFNAVSGEASFSLLQAVRFLRNHWEVKSDGTLVVYREDGTTQAWTRLVGIDATAKPIVSVT